jgi:hypothetical protein
VAVGGREQCVDVTPAHRVFEGDYRYAGVVVDEKARYPANAEPARIDALDRGAAGRVSPGPDTYEGV